MSRRVNWHSDPADDTTESGEDEEYLNWRNRQGFDRVSPDRTPVRRPRLQDHQPDALREVWESADEEIDTMLKDHAARAARVARRRSNAADRREAAAASGRNTAASGREIAASGRGTAAPRRDAAIRRRGVAPPRRVAPAPEEETTTSEEESETLSQQALARPQNEGSSHRVIPPTRRSQALNSQIYAQPLSQVVEIAETESEDESQTMPRPQHSPQQHVNGESNRASSTQGEPSHNDLTAERSSKHPEPADDASLADESREQAGEFPSEAAASELSTYSNALPPRPTLQPLSLRERAGEVTREQDDRAVQSSFGAGVDQSAGTSRRMTLRQSLAPFAKRNETSKEVGNGHS